MYIDIVVEALVKSDLGCHVMGKYFGCLLYADDLILLSASVLQVQKMLDLFLYLLESYCLPISTYAVKGLPLNKKTDWQFKYLLE